MLQYCMILSIESSCDDSSIAITQIDSKKLLFHKKISQNKEHSKYGGVVPELAARLHTQALPKILEEAKEYLPHIKAIAVTNEPGLSVTLVEGVMMAKALSIALKKPIIAVNHLIGHIYSLFIEKESFFPLLVLLVSGGHTQIMHITSYNQYKKIASTMDDSLGESFDKVAKMLHLGYPGGPIVEQYAQKGNEERFNFTIPLINSSKIAFSYSGLKNQVRLEIMNLKKLTIEDKYDICASFQKTATLHLLHKLQKVFKQKPYIKDFAIVGGVSANLYIRDKIKTLCNRFQITLHTSELKYCTDNAAMIGRYGIEAYKHKDFIPLNQLQILPKK